MKLYVETKDNVKFLTMLERHFKNMSLGDLSTTLETIPSMMNSLRLIWVISHHCNKEGTRMLSLLCLIAEEIADQVAKLINIRAIFRRKYAHAMQTVQLGKKVLDSWKYTYKEVRSRIEHSDNNERWEFRPQDLFGRTEYMSKICDDLYKVAKTLDQFDKFLGKELRSVTDDPGIDVVMEDVKGLIPPLKNLKFNIFDPRPPYKKSWNHAMQSFDNKVREIEKRAATLIDTSFVQLRSAEAAFHLLQNFRNIQSREAIQKRMMEKFTNILTQYDSEIDEVRAGCAKFAEAEALGLDEAQLDDLPCALN